ncbi:MAG: hypothetical protein VKI81_02680 [Synechococcaceae cyanobacterium]|nr:hypothetical protein [Synechococcaceae cyanobacterium]
MDSASRLLATGYTSTMVGIAGLSVIACVSLLMTVRAISEFESGSLPGAELASAFRSLKF